MTKPGRDIPRRHAWLLSAIAVATVQVGCSRPNALFGDDASGNGSGGGTETSPASSASVPTASSGAASNSATSGSMDETTSPQSASASEPTTADPSGPSSATNEEPGSSTGGLRVCPTLASPCDAFLQTGCGEQQACRPQGDERGYSQTGCVDVENGSLDDGFVCTSECNPFSGIDDCPGASVCDPFVDGKGEPRCIPLCGGSAQSPSCAPDLTCQHYGDHGLCRERCTPLANDCPDGFDCVVLANGFGCAPQDSGPISEPGDTCLNPSDCTGGLLCGLSVELCSGGPCCLEVCEFDDNGDSCSVGAGTCVPYQDAGGIDLGEGLGVCV